MVLVLSARCKNRPVHDKRGWGGDHPTLSKRENPERHSVIENQYSLSTYQAIKPSHIINTIFKNHQDIQLQIKSNHIISYHIRKKPLPSPPLPSPPCPPPTPPHLIPPHEKIPAPAMIPGHDRYRSHPIDPSERNPCLQTRPQRVHPEAAGETCWGKS